MSLFCLSMLFEVIMCHLKIFSHYLFLFCIIKVLPIETFSLNMENFQKILDKEGSLPVTCTQSHDIYVRSQGCHNLSGPFQPWQTLSPWCTHALTMR